MTTLLKPVSRVTARNFKHYKRPLAITLIPGTETRDDLIAFRLKGTRAAIPARVVDLYTMAALWYGQKMATAKRQARKDGVPWAKARKQFLRDNKISA